MKICPNEDCVHRRRTGKAAEYRDEVDACADCGAELEEGREQPPSHVDQVPASPLDRSLLLRLGITILLLGLQLVLGYIPIPGVDVGAIRQLGMDSHRETFTIAALGLNSIWVGFQLVELVALAVPRLRPMRISGPVPRVRLFAASLAVTLLSSLVQAYFICRWLEGLQYSSYSYGPMVVEDPGSAFVLVATSSMVAAVFLSVGVALLIWRFGLGNGFAVLFGWLMLQAIPDGVVRQVQEVQVGIRTPISVAVWLLASGVIVVAAIQLLRTSARVPASGEIVERTIHAPTCGWVPISWAASALLIPTTLANFGLPFLESLSQRLVPGTLVYLGLNLALVIGFGIGFSQLFYRSDLVAGLLSPGRGDARPLEEGIQKLLRRRTLITLGYLAGMIVASHFLAKSGITVDVTAMVVLAAVALDLRQEWGARRRGGGLVKVWELHRLYATAPVVDKLAERGITPLLRGLHFRSLFYFFAPYVPVDVMVPGDRADEARELMVDRLIPPYLLEDDGGSDSEDGVPG
jgi:preprotein translocase subunit SecY